MRLRTGRRCRFATVGESTEKSPRMVPGAARTGSVSPTSLRTVATAWMPSSTAATTGALAT